MSFLHKNGQYGKSEVIDIISSKLLSSSLQRITDMSEKDGKYNKIHYHDYLGLEKVLDAQDLRSEKLGDPAHEEMLFIIVHQVYELWFKQIIHELGSVVDLFKKNTVDEQNIGVAVARMNRVEEIFELIIKQIQIMETMTPLDFLDFRALLFPASGFQSFQFRAIEAIMGLPNKQRMTYHNTSYSSVFPEHQQKALADIYENGTLYELVEDWLERTPFLNLEGFDFLEQYGKAVRNMLKEERNAIKESDLLSDKEKEKRLIMLEGTDSYFDSILDKEAHDKLVAEGQRRLSHKATLAALFINLYRDEPILHMPFQLLTSLIEMDDLFTAWRYRHAQMVLRMLGNKVGTGGSSGHDYLAKTAAKHKIFTDFHNISTLLIPRSALPILPKHIKEQLSFTFTKEM